VPGTAESQLVSKRVVQLRRQIRRSERGLASRGSGVSRSLRLSAKRVCSENSYTQRACAVRCAQPVMDRRLPSSCPTSIAPRFDGRLKSVVLRGCGPVHPCIRATWPSASTACRS